MKAYLAHRLQKIYKQAYLKANRHKLNNRSFSIISNNCWGGILYSDLGLFYQTPFVNMYIHAPCYLQILSDLKGHLSENLRFVHHSRYLTNNVDYPIGVIRNAEIHFIHYRTAVEASTQWQKRLERVNYENLVVQICERDFCTPSDIHAFHSLPYKNKLSFTASRYDYAGSFSLPFFNSHGQVLPADQIAGYSYHRCDIIKFLNDAQQPG